MKRIVLTGGGTAGHITPNIALMPELKKRGYRYFYIGSYDGMEKEMILFLEEHYQEDISLDMLAAQFRRTPEYLCGIFKAATGETISHYLRRIRIHQAKVLLMERPDAGLSEISAACGFHSVSYFGKVFREATGFTPQGYRLGSVRK